MNGDNNLYNTTKTGKRFTYRTDAEVNASLNAKGVATRYTVLIAGETNRTHSKTHTFNSAKSEVLSWFRVKGFEGMVMDTRNGEIVYTTNEAPVLR